MLSTEAFHLSTLVLVFNTLPIISTFSIQRQETETFSSLVNTVESMVKDRFLPDFHHIDGDRDFHNPVKYTNYDDALAKQFDEKLYKTTATYLKADIDRLNKKLNQEKTILRKISEISMGSTYHKHLNMDLENTLRPQLISKRDHSDLVDKRTYDMYQKYLERILRFIHLRNERSRSRSIRRQPEPIRSMRQFREHNTFDLIGSGIVGR